MWPLFGWIWFDETIVKSADQLESQVKTLRQCTRCQLFDRTHTEDKSSFGIRIVVYLDCGYTVFGVTVVLLFSSIDSLEYLVCSLYFLHHDVLSFLKRLQGNLYIRMS